jgi:hypothetical protein
MSQATTGANILEPDSHQSEVPDAKYSELRVVLDSVIQALAPGLKMQVVSRYLGETTVDEYERLVLQPAWLRMALRAKGDALVVKLLKENWEHTGTTAIVRSIYGIPSSTLHREKDRGGVIAYRRSDKGDFVYPLEQFGEDTIHEWAGELVSAVGNGDAALQFLYVKRASLGGKGFAEAFREDAAATVEPFRKSIRRLAAE